MKNNFQGGLSKGRRRFLKAFTLVELIVVITILAILATVGFLALSGYSQDAKDSAIKANVRSLHTAISSESAVSGNSPRYYVVHDTGAALSGAFAYVDGTQVFLTGGNWDQAGTNYSAGNPDYSKLKLNPEKFKVGFRPFDRASAAAYDAKYLAVGAFDATVGIGTKARTASYFQIAGIAPATGVASVSGNFPATQSGGSVAGLVKDPKVSSSTGALVDGGNSSLPPSPVNGVCGSASKGYAFSAASFGSDTFCSAGTASPVSPAFPAAGGSVNWTCSASNGGNVPTCTATRAAAANCSASTQTVNGRTYSVGTISNGATLASSSSSVVNGGTRAYSQTFLCTDGAVSASGAETEGAVTCSAAGYVLIGGSCVPNSCKSVKAAYPASVDGTYSIDPDGTLSGFSATNVFCDMTTSGGGWTLVSWNKGTSGTVGANFFVAASNTANLANKNLANTAASINAEGFSNAANTSAAMLKSAVYSASPIIDNATGKWNYDSTRCGGTLSHTSRTAGCA